MLQTSRETSGIETCNAHVFYFHNGGALLPRIWTDYEDQEDDLFAVYSTSEDFICRHNGAVCHQKTSNVKNRNNLNRNNINQTSFVNGRNGLSGSYTSFILEKLMISSKRNHLTE